MSDNYKFFVNEKCEYFPCHKMLRIENFNCLFCFCPLYMLGDKCGGNIRYTETGIKSCAQCILPHVKDVGYNHIMSKMKEVLEKGKK